MPVLRFGKTSLVLRPKEGSQICIGCRPIYDETALVGDGWANASLVEGLLRVVNSVRI